VTDTARSHFAASVLPYVKKIAVDRSSGTENLHDREDEEATFIAKAWEHYVRLTEIDPEPALHRVLCQLYKPEPVWTHRPEPDFRVLSLGNPRIRRMAEAVPA
jgi:hypothetical protein